MDASPKTSTLFQFPANIPDAISITVATFRCWAGSSSEPGADLWLTRSDWDEHTITWDNAPMPDFTADPVGSTGPVNGGEYAEADVTSAITDSGDYTFVLGTTSNIR